MLKLKRGCPIIILLTGCTPMLTSLSPEENTNSANTNGNPGYFLPKADLQFILSDRNGEIEVKINAPEIKADQNKFYLLKYNPSPFASDAYEIDIDPKTSLLTKIDMKADDKLDDVVVEIARSFALAEGAPDAQPGKVLLQRSVDPADDSSVKKLENDMNINLQNNALIQINNACKDRESTPCAAYNRIINQEVTVKLEIDNPSPYSRKDADCSVGICYRVAMPYGIKVDFKGMGVSYQGNVNLPNNMPALALDLNRVSFVSKTTVIHFENGVIDKIKAEKPSEGLELVSLPLKIVSAAFDTVAKLVQFKIDTTQREIALATERIKLIEAQAKLQEKKLHAEVQEASREAGPLLVARSFGQLGRIPNISQFPPNTENRLRPLSTPGSPGTS